MAQDNHIENTMPRITVVGVGGAGGNAVNNMIRSNLEGVEFIVANTDAQALTENLATQKLHIGRESTQGLGAGSKPEVGRLAAEEDVDDIQKSIKGSHMVFITAGMGGGTGTGAAPIIAKAAREQGILTVGVVTKPFHFEGAHRMRTAETGIEELHKIVDTLIIIPNQNLFRLANEKTTFADAFNMADNVLYSGVRGVTDLMIMPGLVNLDFADVRTVMSEMGKAMMGTGEAEGDNRAIEAAEAAISNPLLDEVSMRGARGVLINITGGMDMTLFEVDEAANRIREEVDGEANIIFGSTFDERLSGRMRVSVVATGIDAETQKRLMQSRFAHGEQMPLIEKEEGARAGHSDAQPEAEAYAVGTEEESRFKIGDPLPEAVDDAEARISPISIGGGNEGADSSATAAESMEESPLRASHIDSAAAPQEKKKPSFLERIGLKRSKQEQQQPLPEKAAASHAIPHAEEKHSGLPHNVGAMDDKGIAQELSQGLTGADENVTSFGPKEENLDIPAFLRKSRKKN